MNIEDVNLNLLKVMDTILQEKSVSKAADKLNQSQPATTHALNKLRKVFKDKLFVKTTKGMEPTDFARNIQIELRSIMSQIDVLLSKESAFDPLKSERSFRVGIMEFSDSILIPPLMRWITENKSNLQIHVKMLPLSDVVDFIDDGEVEMAISYVRDIPSHINYEKIFEIEPVCLISKDHPLANKEMDVYGYVAYPHIAVSSWLKTYRGFTDYLAKRNVKRKITLILPNPMAIGDILPDTDLIATVPASLSKYFLSRQPNLVEKPFPCEVSKPEIRLLWHARHDKDSGHLWLRKMLMQFAAQYL